MSGVRLFMILVLLPALVALGHDGYLFYTNYGVESVASVQADLAQAYEDKGVDAFFAALGFIWTQYHPESYKMIAQGVEPEQWAVINEFLTFKAFYVGLVFAGFFYVILLALRILGTWPFNGESSGSSKTIQVGAIGKKQGGKYQYKRK